MPPLPKTTSLGRYGRNTIWMTAEQVLRLLLGFSVGIWVARYLGPGDYGKLSYALSVVGLAVPFVSLGMATMIVRDLLLDRDEKHETLGTIFLLRAVAAICFLALFAGLTTFDVITAEPWILLLVSLMLIAVPFQTVESLFEARVEGRFPAMAKIVVLVGTSSLRIGFILGGCSVIYFAGVFAAEALLTLIALVTLLRLADLPLWKWRFNPDIARKMLRDALPIVLSSIALALILNLDRIMLGHFNDAATVGIYTVGAQLVMVCGFIPTVIANSFFPAIMNAKKHSESFYYERYGLLIDALAVMALGMAVCFTIGAPILIEVLYGEQYLESVPVLQIYAWIIIFLFVGIGSGKWFAVEEKLWSAFLRYSTGALLNVALNSFLIPRYGPTGAAISTLVAIAVAYYLGNVLSPKTRRLFALQTRAIFLLNIVADIRVIWSWYSARK